MKFSVLDVRLQEARWALVIPLAEARLRMQVLAEGENRADEISFTIHFMGVSFAN